MQLSELVKKIREYPERTIKINADPKINNVHYDSRKIHSGDLFVAIEGYKFDGHDFIEKAIERGAIAIVCQKNVYTPKHIPQIKVKNTRKCLAKIACILNNNPSSKLILLGITGTNGKTTTSYILEQIIKKSGFSPGIIGTINQRCESFTKKNSMTTPESADLQDILHKMHQSGTTHVIIEVSSHALDLFRVDGCKFDIAIFTNLTQDHLDYHQTMEKYWSSKQKLFNKHLKKNGTAIINMDDSRGKILIKSMLKNVKIISTGEKKECIVKLSSFKSNSKGIHGEIVTPNGKFKFTSPLLGEFNISNILSATGAGLAMGFSLNNIAAGIEATKHVPGRLELVSNSKDISVYTDYAHTPDALGKTLKTINSLNKGRTITIFGCGGERDSSKRSIMGGIAGKLSDLVIITSDNPRSENINKINNQIIEGIHQKNLTYISSKKITPNWRNKSYTLIVDRKKAIFTGISAAKKKDTILITGKGHETYQIHNGEIFEFNDKKEVINALVNTK